MRVAIANNSRITSTQLSAGATLTTVLLKIWIVNKIINYALFTATTPATKNCRAVYVVITSLLKPLPSTTAASMISVKK